MKKYILVENYSLNNTRRVMKSIHILLICAYDVLIASVQGKNR